MRSVSRQFAFFVVNGGMIGILCWGLQLGCYHALGQSGTAAYWTSAMAASAIGITINFQIQRRFIFARHGNFWLFALAATGVSIVVSFAAVMGRDVLALFFDPSTAARFGYVAGALAIAPFSFALKKFVIFRG